jgi:hypothetical protein
MVPRSSFARRHLFLQPLLRFDRVSRRLARQPELLPVGQSGQLARAGRGSYCPLASDTTVFTACQLYISGQRNSGARQVGVAGPGVLQRWPAAHPASAAFRKCGGQLFAPPLLGRRHRIRPCFRSGCRAELRRLRGPVQQSGLCRRGPQRQLRGVAWRDGLRQLAQRAESPL